MGKSFGNEFLICFESTSLKSRKSAKLIERKRTVTVDLENFKLRRNVNEDELLT